MINFLASTAIPGLMLAFLQLLVVSSKHCIPNNKWIPAAEMFGLSVKKKTGYFWIRDWRKRVSLDA